MNNFVQHEARASREGPSREGQPLAEFRDAGEDNQPLLVVQEFVTEALFCFLEDGGDVPLGLR